MTNEYEIIEDIVYIHLYNDRITKISLCDLGKANEFKGRWVASLKKGKNWYVESADKQPDGTKKTVRLHRWIMDAPKGMVVDHINHDTLDNTRSNLRIITSAQNSQNHKGARSDNLMGLRNISIDKRSGNYQVRIMCNGVMNHLGTYSDIEQAKKVAKEGRKTLLPFNVED